MKGVLPFSAVQFPTQFEKLAEAEFLGRIVEALDFQPGSEGTAVLLGMNAVKRDTVGAPIPSTSSCRNNLPDASRSMLSSNVLYPIDASKAVT